MPQPPANLQSESEQPDRHGNADKTASELPDAQLDSQPPQSTSAQTPSAAPSWLGLRWSDQVGLVVLSLIVFVLLIIHWIRLTGGNLHPVVVRHPEGVAFRVDVNRASWIEWSQLDGIGDALAHRIVADREANGPFSSIDDLTRVRGIGTATLNRFRHYLLPVEQTHTRN